MSRSTSNIISGLVLIFCGLSTVNSIADVGDELIITGNIVNLRTEPSTESNSPIKLLKDKKVIEMQRQGDWVEVATGRKDVKTGWVYKTLIKKAPKKGDATAKRYSAFQQRFKEYNETITTQNGTHYFLTTRNKNDTTVELIATEIWLNAEIEERQDALSKVFKLWSDVVPVGISTSVIVLDKQDKQHMLMLR